MSIENREALAEAYVFLRDVEHKLQMVHDLQTHSLPAEQEELKRCAIRMGYGDIERSAACKRFIADHTTHTKAVHEQFTSFLGDPNSSAIFRATLRPMR